MLVQCYQWTGWDCLAGRSHWPQNQKLIAIAIVASKGNAGGLEKQIRSGKKQFGITKEEVMDVLKVVLLTSGMQAFNSSLQVVYDIFE